MNLYLMRHAIAVDADDNSQDRLRPLTAKGRLKLIRIAQNLKNLDITFDLILTSPALRALQTAETVAGVLGLHSKKVIQTENLAPPGSTVHLLAEIIARESLDNLLIVGHEPYLSQLIGMLLAGDASLSIRLKKAGLCKLSFEQLVYGRCATLEWLLTPAQLLAMGTHIELDR